MTDISWSNPVSGDFDTPSDWDFNTVPGPRDEAIIAAQGGPAYSVTVDENVSVKGLTIVPDVDGHHTYSPTLVVEAATFSAAGIYSDASIELYDGAFIDTKRFRKSEYIYGMQGRSAIESNKLINDGEIIVEAGATLSIGGKIKGNGSAQILGGSLAFAGEFDQKVTFSGGGHLELAVSAIYSKSVAGFSTDGNSSIDLNDITFVGTGEATFSGTPTNGILTVTDGKHTASIHLDGDYLGATFTASSDGHGGTIVVADGVQNAKPPPAMISAMAAFGASPAHACHGAEAWSVREPMLAGPRVAMA